jgi:hypothetical protein
LARYGWHGGYCCIGVGRAVDYGIGEVIKARKLR